MGFEKERNMESSESLEMPGAQLAGGHFLTSLVLLIVGFSVHGEFC